MTEKPILFSGEMVRQILAGNKTQTRRVMKPQPTFSWNGARWANPVFYVKKGEGTSLPYAAEKCPNPYGKLGDRLWVRETWSVIGWSKDYETGWVDEIWEESVPESKDKLSDNQAIAFAADDGWNSNYEDRGFNWRPSIHMPRWASRITLEITNIGIERLQDITEEDAKAEGVEVPTALEFLAKHTNSSNFQYRVAFMSLWDKINAKRGFGWSENPFVWTVEFKKI